MNYISQAEEFIDGGFNPLPLLSPSKAPKLPQGHNFLYEPIDKIKSRFSNCDMIGITCGTISGGFYCLDFDCHGGQDIDSIFKEFINNGFIKYLKKEGKLSILKTPSGGYHCYYKHEYEHGGRALAHWPEKNGKTEVMIEIRGNGQYVATYPSPGYSQTKWVDIYKLDYISKEDLDHIINLASSFSKIQEEVKSYEKNSRKWPDKWDDLTPDGNYNNTQGDHAKQLLKEAGWNLISTRRSDGVELWQRPGKTKDQGISATFGAQHNMFYVFSSSASPFSANTGYTPFNIYTILKFNGDWKKAKDSLRPEPEPEVYIPDIHSFFPIEVFPEQIQRYILELNRTLNFHIDFSAAAAMFAIATINGNKMKLKVKNGWEAPTIFWFACVGYPGTIKTHPVKMLTKPIVTLDKTSKRDWDEEMKHYDPDKKQPKPKFKQILISDYTLEALHSIHDINRRGIGLYKDELKGFLNDMNKYRKGSDEEFWLESFNNGSYIVNRVTKDPIMINNICINIIGTIQHDVLSKVVSDYAGNGLIDRFLFTSSETKVYELTAHEIDNRFFDFWQKLIHNINTDFKYFGEDSTEIVKMSDETFKIYQQIDSEYVVIQNNEDHSQDIKNYLSKMKTYIPRFALLLAIMEGVCDGVYIEVKPIHMLNAKKVADYFVKTAERVYDQNSTTVEIKEIESGMRGLSKHEKIAKLFKKGIKQKDLAKYFGVSKQAISKAIKST